MATYTGADKALAFLFDIAASIAEDYIDSATYAVGAYTIYAGTLYKCTSAVSSPETFDPTKWSAVLIMSEVAAGGGGGGTTVIANPAGAATDTLNKLQVASTIYQIPSGGGGSHTYSTTEQIVGTWIDGKTVYEKTFTGLSIAVPARGSSWINTNIDATNVTAIVQAFCMDASGQYYPTQVVIFGATQTFGINFQCHTNRDITTIVLQYAK